MTKKSDEQLTLLRRTRMGLNLLLDEVCADLGVHKAWMSKIETGSRSCGYWKAKALVEYYRSRGATITLDDFYEAYGGGERLGGRPPLRSPDVRHNGHS